MILAACGTVASSPVPAATVAPFPGNAGGATPLLVDASWLRKILGEESSPDVRVVDLSPPRVYETGHIPGAIHAWWQDTIDRFYPVYGVVLSERQDPGARARLLTRLGIGEATLVVAYDDARGRYAARLFWVLRYFGHERAALLDGGLAAWRGAGGAADRDEAKAPAVAPPAVVPQPGFIVGTRELRDRLGDPGLVLLDARTPVEAADDLNGALRSGRIPGAVAVPWTATLRDEAGRLNPPDELAALFRAAGVAPDQEIVVSARFGVEASHTWLVLKLRGYPNVRLYDQGWAEWAARPELPIEALPPPDGAGR